MLIVISPAKTLDFETSASTKKYSQPIFLDESKDLVKVLKKCNTQDLQAMMSISEKLAELNAVRFQEWQPPFTLENAKQAIFAFQGDVYTGLKADQLDTRAINYLQKNLRILSGLYGLLRPLDLIQPYRLEMGRRLSTELGSTLYDFWDDRITNEINSQLLAQKNPTLINLASNEYAKAIQLRKLNATVITPVFKDLRNGQYKVISFLAKKARGAMVNFLASEKMSHAEDLKRFNRGGYTYQEELSEPSKWVFTRSSNEPI